MDGGRDEWADGMHIEDFAYLFVWMVWWMADLLWVGGMDSGNRWTDGLID
jgi:hypothetical protein